MNDFVPIGCVETTNAREAGFIPFSDISDSTNTIEQCIQKAEEHGKLCAENSKNNDPRCSYIVYDNGSIYDNLREADSIYQKYSSSHDIDQKNRYLNNALDLFRKIWLSLSVEERKKQLSDNGGIRFMYGYAPWIKKNNNFMKFFIDNQNSKRIPIKLKNTCWIGGNKVIDKGFTKLIDFESNNKNPKCKYNLYLIPGTEGNNYKDRLFAHYKQIANQHKEKAKKAEIKAKTSDAMAKFINESGDLDIFSLFNKAKNTKSKIELDMTTKDTRNSIKNYVQKMKDKEEHIQMINSLGQIANKAFDNHSTIISEKKKVLKKMNADIQNMNWSLEENKSKENLQHKITTTLGIIIILFVILCVTMIIYYLIGGTKLFKQVSSKTQSNVLDNIFGKSSVINKKSSKVLANIFK